MSVTLKQFVPAKTMENIETTQYTADNVISVIDKCTVSNYSASNVTFSMNIVAADDTPANSNKIIVSRTVAPNEVYTCPEMIGQVLVSGSYLATIAGAPDALVIAVSGREIT